MLHLQPRERHASRELDELPKATTGISGLDEITNGGLPRGRPTLICGTAGCGKSMLAMEFLVRGASQHDEPGVFVAFEENRAELVQNARSLGFDLEQLEADEKLVIDHVYVERSDIQITGEWDLEGLFLRLQLAIDAVGAKRVVLDTIEALFAALPDEFTTRAELRRLFRWLKEKGVTAVITAERGDGSLTRHGLEEYVSDCVILLDHRVLDQVSTRRLRVVKYRGSPHGTNEYPFLIGDTGFSVLPITAMGLDHEATDERVSIGVPKLDAMLGGEGLYRGSSVLVSGTAGTGKSSLAVHFVDAACARGERALYLAFEESPQQMVRNMRSIGRDLQPWLDSGLLRIESSRPTAHGLEVHLAMLHRLVASFDPRVVVIDPITNFLSIGSTLEVNAMLTRMVDLLKSRGITALFTSLTNANLHSAEQTEVGISSIIDTWLLVRELEQNGERNRALYVLKSRGMAHSKQVREFLLTSEGIDLVDVFVSPDGVLTGSAKAQFEARERLRQVEEQLDLERKSTELARKRGLIEAQIAALKAELDHEESELSRLLHVTSERTQRTASELLSLSRQRQDYETRANAPVEGK